MVIYEFNPLRDILRGHLVSRLNDYDRNYNP